MKMTRQLIIPPLFLLLKLQGLRRISSIARLLLNKVEIWNLNKAEAKLVCSLLPNLLQAFAQKLAHGPNMPQLYRDIMVPVMLAGSTFVLSELNARFLELI